MDDGSEQMVNMAIDPESFDVPVEDYDFSALAAKSDGGENTARTLLDQMSACKLSTCYSTSCIAEEMNALPFE